MLASSRNNVKGTDSHAHHHELQILVHGQQHLRQEENLANFKQMSLNLAVLDNSIFGFSRSWHSPMLNSQKPRVSVGSAVPRISLGRYLLQREGLETGKRSRPAFSSDNQTGRLLAVEANRADAAIVTPPITLMARKKGFPLLIDAARLKIPYTSAVLVTRKSFIQANRPVAVNFMKGLIEAICYYKTHKEESFKVMSKYLRIQDREVLDENFRAYDHSVRPYATHEELELPIQEVGKSNPNVLKADPLQFVDHSILKELETSGFVDRVAAQYGLK